MKRKEIISSLSLFLIPDLISIVIDYFPEKEIFTSSYVFREFRTLEESNTSITLNSEGDICLIDHNKGKIQELNEKDREISFPFTSSPKFVRLVKDYFFILTDSCQGSVLKIYDLRNHYEVSACHLSFKIWSMETLHNKLYMLASSHENYFIVVVNKNAEIERDWRLSGSYSDLHISNPLQIGYHNPDEFCYKDMDKLSRTQVDPPTIDLKNRSSEENTSDIKARIYLFEDFNNAIHAFDIEGKFIRRFSLQDILKNDMLTDAYLHITLFVHRGYLYVASLYQKEIWILDLKKDGQLVRVWKPTECFLKTLVISRKGEIALYHKDGNTISFFQIDIV